MKRDEFIYLKVIRDAAAKVELYVQGIDESSFKERGLVQDAVIRQFEVIGAVGRKISPEMKSVHPQLRFQAIAEIYEGLRQDYFTVDLQKVWDAATAEAGNLKANINRILGEPANA